ncbi:hypothetical protein CEXT_693101 [Caerostris extrusa]|uniref:Uncharacterized protein n=1 Tax=Caerostris extrusa TaxID=172846 RepID=A0AAV4T2V0_CAEEX|nr:hypothetical protein CEXT_693101 [Caerostris extrusa]
MAILNRLFQYVQNKTLMELVTQGCQIAGNSISVTQKTRSEKQSQYLRDHSITTTVQVVSAASLSPLFR